MATVDGGTPNPENQNISGAGDNTQNPPQPPPVGAQPPVGGQPVVQPPAVQEFRYKEDRSDWVPRHRLNEESGKRTKLEQQIASLTERVEQEQRRVRAALGIDTPSPDAAKRAEVRTQVVTLLKEMTPEEREELFPGMGEQREAVQAAEQAARAQWDRHSNGMLTDLEDEAATLLNVDKLSEPQSNRLRRAFREEARERAIERAEAIQRKDDSYDYKNDFVARYERGDKKLLQEFAKSFMEEWGIPARRSNVASEVRRGNRPVPRGERQRAPMTQQPPKINYNDDKAFKDAMTAARNGGGEV